MKCGMLKVPPAARTDVCGVYDANSSWTFAAAADGACGSAVTVTMSADAVGSWIERLSYHHMMSVNVCDGLELVRQLYNGRFLWISRFRPPRWGGYEV